MPVNFQCFSVVVAIVQARQTKIAAALRPGPERIVCAYHAGIKTESDEAFAAFVGQHFIIDEANAIGQNSLEQAPVVGLCFDGVGEKQVRGFV